MVWQEPLDQFGNSGWWRWAAIAFVTWGAVTPLMLIGLSVAIVTDWPLQMPLSTGNVRNQAAAQILPWAMVLCAYGVTLQRLIRRRPATSVWALGFALMACMILLNSSMDEGGNVFRQWPAADALDSLIRPAATGMLVFCADISVLVRQRRQALRGE